MLPWLAIEALAQALGLAQAMAHRYMPPAIQAMAMGLTPPAIRAMAMGLTPPALQAMAMAAWAIGPPAGWRSIMPAGIEAISAVILSALPTSRSVLGVRRRMNDGNIVVTTVC
jgi:hypothetical protein